MYEKDISLQQAEVETLKVKHTEAIQNIDSLSDLVTNLKSALESEKENAQIVLSQFKKADQDRKDHVRRKEELEEELASRMVSENTLKERVRNLERVESELTSKVKAAERLHSELEALRTVIKTKDEEISFTKASLERMKDESTQQSTDLSSKLDEAKRKETFMHERFVSLEASTKSLQSEFKQSLRKKENETSKLRVVLQEAKEKLERLWEENEHIKSENSESVQSLNMMLRDAIRSRGDADASLQESLQLLEQQKRIDIKRKGEIAKLEQTVDVLKSKERYQEKYIESLKKQIRRV